MTTLTNARGRMWIGVTLCAAAVAALVVWMATLGHNAWALGPVSPAWPRFVGLHHGRIVVISTLWRPSATGVRAWESADWIYDVIGGPESWLVASYARIGDSYGGTPPYKTDLDAAFIPIWWLAVPLAWLGVAQVRKARRLERSGRCGRCGYLRHGLLASASCPECGAAPADARETMATRAG